METVRWTRQQLVNRLKAEMERQGLTNAELARRTGLSAPAISSYVNPGDIGHMPSLSAARRIATALRVPLDYLWPETPSEVVAYSHLQLAGMLDEMEKLLATMDRPNSEQVAQLETNMAALEASRQLANKPRFVTIELLHPATGERHGCLVLEVPPEIKSPVGILDGSTTWLVDIGGDATGDRYLHLSGGGVEVNSSPDSALGPIFACLLQ